MSPGVTGYVLESRGTSWSHGVRPGVTGYVLESRGNPELFFQLILDKKKMKLLPSANFPPGHPPGKFIHEHTHTVYNCAGDVQGNPTIPVKDRTISLNEFATGEAIAKATHVAHEHVWFFAVVLQDGSQHVYEGTPSQASKRYGQRSSEGLQGA